MPPIIRCFGKKNLAIPLSWVTFEDTVIERPIGRSVYRMSKSSLTLGIVLLLVVLTMLFFWLNRARKVAIDAALPENFPAQGFSHRSYEELLESYVDADGRVDYARWHQLPASRQQLDAYLSAVSQFSPDSTPSRFSNRNDELAYWMYAYNAYVIKSVLDHWPLKSVTDVKAPLEVVRGLGFFYQLRFSFGGEFMSLLVVENKKIRKQYKDPRIHFVLNCASASCPIARPGLPIGDDLEALLADATVEFVNNIGNVHVDHDQGIVYLSRIFKWYEEDFASDVRIRGNLAGNELLSYVAEYASDDLSRDLARAEAYEVTFRDYDWGLNSSSQ